MGEIMDEEVAERIKAKVLAQEIAIRALVLLALPDEAERERCGDALVAGMDRSVAHAISHDAALLVQMAVEEIEDLFSATAR